MKKITRNIILIAVTLVWMILGSWFSILAQGSGTNDVESLYRQGLAAYKANDFKTFLECFKKLDTMIPGHPTILYNLAAGYSLNKQPEEALRYLQRLIIIDANTKIAEDKDFESLRHTPGFKEILTRIQEINKPISNSDVVFTVKERDLHPESIAFDSKTQTFYLSSVHKRKIVSIGEDGKVIDFTGEGQDGLDSVLGIRIDAAQRILWASSAAGPHMKGYNETVDKGRSGVFKYHLDSKKLIKKYILQEGDDHGFDDVVLHPGGDVYVSDQRMVYRIPAAADHVELAVRYP